MKPEYCFVNDSISNIEISQGTIIKEIINYLLNRLVQIYLN